MATEFGGIRAQNGLFKPPSFGVEYASQPSQTQSRVVPGAVSSHIGGPASRVAPVSLFGAIPKKAVYPSSTSLSKDAVVVSASTGGGPSPSTFDGPMSSGSSPSSSNTLSDQSTIIPRESAPAFSPVELGFVANPAPSSAQRCADGSTGKIRVDVHIDETAIDSQPSVAQGLAAPIHWDQIETAGASNPDGSCSHVRCIGTGALHMDWTGAGAALPAPATSAAVSAAARRLGCRDVSDFRVLSAVGSGMYGEVSRACDPATGDRVALKKMTINKDKETEGFPITALREIKALRALAGHPNVIGLRDVAEGRPSVSKGGKDKAAAMEKDKDAPPGDLYLVLDFFEGSLHGLLNMPESVRSHEHIRVYMWQLLSGLAHMHSKGYLHRDIKPANLLMTKDHRLAIADFGLANRWRPGSVMTHTVVTLWYRAPELLLGDRNTGPPVDLWSAGVVLLELLTGYPIHRRDESQRMFAIQDIWALCGCPGPDTWPGVDRLASWGAFSPRKKYTRNVRGKLHKSVPPLALDLLDRLLTLNPAARISAAQALTHPFFACPAYEQPHIGEDIPPIVMLYESGARGAAAGPGVAAGAGVAGSSSLQAAAATPFPAPDPASLPLLPFASFHENDARRAITACGLETFAVRAAVPLHPVVAAAETEAAIAAAKAALASATRPATVATLAPGASGGPGTGGGAVAGGGRPHMHTHANTHTAGHAAQTHGMISGAGTGEGAVNALGGHSHHGGRKRKASMASAEEVGIGAATSAPASKREAIQTGLPGAERPLVPPRGSSPPSASVAVPDSTAGVVPIPVPANMPHPALPSLGTGLRPLGSGLMLGPRPGGLSLGPRPGLPALGRPASLAGGLAGLSSSTKLLLRARSSGQLGAGGTLGVTPLPVQGEDGTADDDADGDGSSIWLQR